MSATAGAPGKYEYVDALRGVAILIVVLLHVSQHVPPSTPWLAWLMIKGELGVQLFYVMSAITLCMSWEARAASERTPIRNFLLRRLFRIAPMFYVAIVVSLLTEGLAARHWAPDGIGWYTVLLTALFVHGYHPETINSVVPGGWSIAVEMTFYLLLPWLLLKAATLRSRLLVLAASLLIYFAWRALWLSWYVAQYPAEQQYLVTGALYYSFFTQLPVFIVGTIAYLLLREPRWQRRTIQVGAIVLIGLALIAALSPYANAVERLLSNHIVGGMLFSLLALTLAKYPIKVLCNPLVAFLGKVSYSMYLTHFAVLAGLQWIGIDQYFPADDLGFTGCALLTIVLAAALSYLCYRLIEVPGIALGKRVIAGLDANLTAAPRWWSVADGEKS